MPIDTKLTVNTASPLFARLKNGGEKQKELASYVYKLALLTNRKLTADEMNEFIKESVRLLSEICYLRYGTRKREYHPRKSE
jgi:HSP90 family molecular chaperone